MEGKKSRRNWLDVFSKMESRNGEEIAQGDETTPKRLKLSSTKELLSRIVPNRKEMERLRKERKAEDVRRRQSELLKPSRLPENKLKRLQELKRVKGNWQRPLKTRQEENPDHSYFVSMERFTLALHTHKRPTRIVVVTLLIGLQFAAVHVKGPKLYSPWHQDGLQASLMSVCTNVVGTILYALVLGVLHFILCDVRLVYALEALELGTKTGNGFKKFYDTKIRVLVASFSGLLLLLGVVKATATSLFRMLQSHPSNSLAWSEDIVLSCGKLYEYSAIFLVMFVTFMDLPIRRYRYHDEEYSSPEECKEGKKQTASVDEIPSLCEVYSRSSETASTFSEDQGYEV